ncbi:hypothetical protein RAA17_03635 [Komagataeibacter rhaeticus]|nr:hypothetical protein [Komagataeibacter rhaeticus]
MSPPRPHYEVMTPLHSPPEPARERSEQRPASRKLVVVGLIAAVVAAGGWGVVACLRHGRAAAEARRPRRGRSRGRGHW